MAERIPMGMGRLGFENLIFKRKFRFTFELEGICGGLRVPKHFVKTVSRPSLSIEEVEINFLNGKSFLPGKATWEEMTVTYIDVADFEMGPLFTWLASVYNFTDPINLQMGSKRRDYTATGILKLWDGCGNLLEIWTMTDVWPKAINFGDLDYSSSEEVTIELTMRYSNVKYQNLCPGYVINPCCSGCTTTPAPVGNSNSSPNGVNAG